MRHVQDKVKNFCEQHNLSTSSEARFLDIVSELGEMAKEILLHSQQETLQRYGNYKLSQLLDKLMNTLQQAF